MALDKRIKSGAEKRKPYRKGKAVSASCRNNGSCAYCRSNRTVKNQKLEAKAKEELKESNQ